MEELINSFENIRIKYDLKVKTLNKHLINIQKCYCSLKLFISYKAKPGDCLYIAESEDTYLCRIFPKQLLHDNVIEIDKTVRLNTVINNLPKVPLLKRPIGLPKIYVDLVFESFQSLSMWNKRTDEYYDSLKKYLLKMFVVTHDCTISLQCLSKLHKMGIDRLIIKFSLDNVKSMDVGYVIDKTNVIINNKITIEQIELHTRPLSPLYALEYPLTRLIEIVSLNDIYCKFLNKSYPQPTKQILLVGPSGCGKSSLIPWVARKTNTLIVSVNDHNIRSSDPGGTEANLRKLFDHAFECAKTMGKCIINLDEISSLCPRRQNKSSHVQRAVTQILQLLDTAHDVPGVIVIATTDNPESIDPSVRRHKRLETEISISPPTENQRCEILNHIIAELNLNLSESDHKSLYESIGSMTPGFVGADLKLICQKMFWNISTNKIKVKDQSANDWIDLFRKVISGMTPASLKGSLGVVTTKQMSFDDLAGLLDIKMTLETSILWPLKHPQAFIRMGISRPKGVLLYGPPGCAKTSLVRALACLGTLSLLSISAAELYSPYVGDAEHLIVQLFKRARQNSPCILFIDEIDAVAGSRSDSAQKSLDVQERILAALLTQMDGVGNQMVAADWKKESIDDGIIVIGATNRPDMIDSALLRPGRFDKHIFVPPPDCKARTDILKLITKNMPIADDVNIDDMANKTENYSGADLKNLCMEAALYALSTDGMDVKEIIKSHFDKALATTRPSLSGADLQRYCNGFK